MQRSLKWSIAAIGLSILLALIGSIDIGHAFFKSPAMTKPTAVSRPKPVATSTQAPTPTPTSMPALTPTATPILVPGATTTTTAQPSPTSTAVTSGGVVLAQDTFARPNQNTWGEASDGQHFWQGDATSSAIFSINNQKGVVSNATGFFSAVIGPATTNATVSMIGQMTNVETGNNGDETSLSALLRWHDNKNWYKAYINGKEFGIRKDVNGQTTTLLTAPFVAQPGVFYTIRFSSSGPMLQASVWQTDAPDQKQSLSVTDNSFSSGRSGMRLGILQGTAIYITSFTESPA
ncbi:MAG: hypothetical protein JOZ18_06250 [Chloroflexi bacterium]|nr:hypothetical protein [Chloroflexota bacterium]